MRVPGGNLLNTALTVIAKQEFKLYAFTSRTLNAVGQWVNTYAAPVTVQGSVQAVDRSRYQELGLDFARNYIQIYASTEITGLTRGTGPDQIGYNGTRWEIMTDLNWRPQDGWNGALAVAVGND